MKYAAVILVMTACLFPGLNAQETIVDTLEATMDAFVDANLPDANYGDFEFLAAFYTGGSEVNSIFVKFDMSHIIGSNMFQRLEDPPVLDKATLELNCKESYGAGNVRIEFPVTGWAEDDINFNNMPYVDGTHTIIWAAIDQPNSVHSYDVGGGIGPRYFTIQPEEDNGIKVSYENGSGDCGADFHSKEAPTSFSRSFVYAGPVLILEYHYASVEEDEVKPNVDLNVQPVSKSRVEISYSLPRDTPASLAVYDATGALVETFPTSSGTHSITYDGTPGVYFVRFETLGKVFTKKTIIVY